MLSDCRHQSYHKRYSDKTKYIRDKVYNGGVGIVGLLGAGKYNHVHANGQAVERYQIYKFKAT